MSTHTASLFDYRAYRQEIAPLVEQVERASFDSLRQHTVLAIRQFSKSWPRSKSGSDPIIGLGKIQGEMQEGPLLLHGDAGMPTEVQVMDSEATPVAIGRWFLILLAKYLTACHSPLANWSVLDTALQRLGWSETDRALLFRGFPIVRVIQPNLAMDAANRSSKASLPYWHGLVIDGADIGWLPLDEISKLYGRLGKLAESIETLQISDMPEVAVDPPAGIRPNEIYLQEGYRETLLMLRQAHEREQGLFMSILQYV